MMLFQIGITVQKHCTMSISMYQLNPESDCQFILTSNDDVVDGNVNQFDEETNETHDAESDSSCSSNLLKLFAIRFGASFDKSTRIFVELLGRLRKSKNLIHVRL